MLLGRPEAAEGARAAPPPVSAMSAMPAATSGPVLRAVVDISVVDIAVIDISVIDISVDGSGAGDGSV